VPYSAYLPVIKRIFRRKSMRKGMLKFLPLFVMASLLTYGCAQSDKAAKTPAAVGQKQEAKVYMGKVVGKSNKAKTISIKMGKGDKAKTIMVKFDDKTVGIEHASKGHSSIIEYEMRDGEPWATVVKPKFARIPEGVTVIKLDELKKIIAEDSDLMLIDARPANRYAASHLPGAVSIPVPAYKEKGASLLPENKDKHLVFYCGGPT
jgi:hypothetical protein